MPKHKNEVKYTGQPIIMQIHHAKASCGSYLMLADE